MKNIIFGLLAFSSLPAFADAGLANSIFKAANCETCEVEFNVSGDQILTSMVNWGKLGAVYSQGIPTTYDSRRKILSINRSDMTCYFYATQDDSGTMQSLKADNDNGNHCPDDLTRINFSLKDERAFNNELLSHIWGADNCDTCEVEFNESNTQILASIVHWGRLGNVYAANLLITYDARRDLLSIAREKDMTCYFHVQRSETGKIQLLKADKDNLNRCPDSMIQKF